ncbi:MAG: HNH endonuclease [Thermoleophilia bacterium]|nr:HNH endonuclease [Thermoleophilia bacterium]
MAGATRGETGVEIAFGPRVGPATLERILCTGRVQIVGLADGRPVVTSNATRAIPPAVRRFVEWRDGGCTADGSKSRYRVEPHHIEHRSEGGDHEPSNLTTLCWFHHHVVIHGMDYRIDPESPPQRRRFIRRTPAAAGHDPP